MNGLPYYKAYPRDFIEGTIGMPFELKGAYRIVLDLIYMQGGRLPDDARYISGLLGCSVRAWKGYREALIEAGKIVVSGEFLTNERAEKELETLAKLQDKQRENGSKPKKANGLQKPRLNHTEPEPEERDKSLSPAPEAREPDEIAFEEFWAAYPRKEDKRKARKAFAAALKTAPAEVILARCRAYAAHRRAEIAAGRSDAQFTRLPTTWLNARPWEDQPPGDPPRAAPRPTEAETKARALRDRMGFGAKAGVEPKGAADPIPLFRPHPVFPQPSPPGPRRIMGA